jgi:hypothetical protein
MSLIRPIAAPTDQMSAVQVADLLDLHATFACDQILDVLELPARLRISTTSRDTALLATRAVLRSERKISSVSSALPATKASLTSD